MSSYPADDTIIAVSTPQGFAMRAIIRLSGPDALTVAGTFFQPDHDSGRQSGFRACPGRLHLPGYGVSTPATLYTMRAPRSYTREDVTELHVPGSAALADMILDEFLEKFPEKLRVAGPGEFTERAFLNGRIDLAQAEAVLAVIRARSRSELLAANAALTGHASRITSSVQKGIAELRALIEAALDFESQGIEILARQDFLKRCGSLRSALSESFGEGGDAKAASDRIEAALCGPPNAGKSSILNRLSGHNNVIVHSTAGTTRDPVKEDVEIGGIPFSLTDTAGLDRLDTAFGLNSCCDPLSAEGIDIDSLVARRAANTVASAGLVMVVFDISAPIPEVWKDIAVHLDRERTLCILNKCDLPRKADPSVLSDSVSSIIRVSAHSGAGFDTLKNAVVSMVTDGDIDFSASGSLFSARQREAAGRAISSLTDAQRAVEEGLGYEFAAVDLQDASGALERVTRGVDSQDVLDRIFSTFCIGK